jgi:hypothetical protein
VINNRQRKGVSYAIQATSQDRIKEKKKREKPGSNGMPWHLNKKQSQEKRYSLMKHHIQNHNTGIKMQVYREVAIDIENGRTQVRIVNALVLAVCMRLRTVGPL